MWSEDCDEIAQGEPRRIRLEPGETFHLHNANEFDGMRVRVVTGDGSELGVTLTPGQTIRMTLQANANVFLNEPEEDQGPPTLN